MSFSRLLVYAKTTPGLEKPLRDELNRVLGDQGSMLSQEHCRRFGPGPGVVALWVSHEGLWQLVHRCRVAERVRIHLNTIELKRTSYREVGRTVDKISWRSYFSRNVIPPVKVKLLPVNDASEPFAAQNSNAVQIRLGKWIYDRLQGVKKVIADVNKEHQWTVAPRFAEVTPGEKQVIAREQFHYVSQVYLRMGSSTSILLDALAGSGDAQLLDRRGYRTHTSNFALREHLAAGCLHAARIPDDYVLWDPFCGTGTIPIEHVARMCQIPSFFGAVEEKIEDGKQGGNAVSTTTSPGLTRNEFAFKKWPVFAPLQASYQECVDKLIAAAKESLLSPKPLTIGSDLSSRILAAARHNAERSQLSSFIRWHHGDFEEVAAKHLPKGCKIAIVTNLPYGNPQARRELREQKKELQLQSKDDKTTALETEGWAEREEANWRGDVLPAKKQALQSKAMRAKEEDEYERLTLKLYKRFGRFLQEHEDLDPVFVISAHPQFVVATGLAWSRVLCFSNGGIAVTLWKLSRSGDVSEAVVGSEIPQESSTILTVQTDASRPRNSSAQPNIFSTRTRAASQGPQRPKATPNFQRRATPQTRTQSQADKTNFSSRVPASKGKSKTGQKSFKGR